MIKKSAIVSRIILLYAHSQLALTAGQAGAADEVAGKHDTLIADAKAAIDSARSSNTPLPLLPGVLASYAATPAPVQPDGALAPTEGDAPPAEATPVEGEAQPMTPPPAEGEMPAVPPLEEGLAPAGSTPAEPAPANPE